MKFTLRKTIIASWLVASLAGGNAPAIACCGDGAAAAAGATAAGAAVSGAITQSTVTVVSWLQALQSTIAAGFGKLAAEIQRQTAELRVMTEGQIAAETRMIKEQAAGEAAVRYTPSPRSCYEVAAASASGRAGAIRGQVARELNDEATARTLFTPNATAAVNKIFDTHASAYCSKQDAELGRCPAATGDMQNADIRADVAFGTSSYTPEQLAAARAFATNVTNPIPTQNIAKERERTPQGRTFLAGQYVEQARASVAANSLSSSLAARVPIRGLGTAAKLDKPDVSEQEVIESQSRGRFESPPWYAMIAGFSLENLMREVAKIQAYRAWKDWQDSQRMERIEILLATQLAMDVRRDSEQRLREARAAAMKK